MRPTRERGQALVEFAIYLPVILIMVGGLVFFGKMYLAKQKAIVGARYAAWHKARNPHLSTEQIQQLVRAKFFQDGEATLVLSAGGVSEDMVGGSGGNAGGAVTNFLAGLTGIVTAEVTYEWPVPGPLRVLGEKRKVVARHEVSANSWPRREIGGLFSIIGDILGVDLPPW